MQSDFAGRTLQHFVFQNFVFQHFVFQHFVFQHFVLQHFVLQHFVLQRFYLLFDLRHTWQIILRCFICCRQFAV